MTSVTLIGALVSGVACLFCFIWAAWLQYCRKHKPSRANQQEDIFNISSRVQGQGQWPTHDSHVSLDHFTLANETNKYNDAPPSYEEAMSIAASNNSSPTVPAAPTVVPKSTPSLPTTSAVVTSTSTSTSTAAAH